MRKQTREITLIDTGLKVLIQGAGSIPGSLYGPIEGYYSDGSCHLRLFVKTTHHMPLGDIGIGYNLVFIAANVTTRIVQIGRYRDSRDTYTVLLSIVEEDLVAINFAIKYDTIRRGLVGLITYEPEIDQPTEKDINKHENMI